MKDKIKVELTRGRLESLIFYVECALKGYVPDHDNVALRLRMCLMKKLRINLLKRQAEAMYSDKLKVSVPEEQALALLDQWMDDMEYRDQHTALSVRAITDEAHKNWM